MKEKESVREKLEKAHEKRNAVKGRETKRSDQRRPSQSKQKGGKIGGLFKKKVQGEKKAVPSQFQQKGSGVLANETKEGSGEATGQRGSQTFPHVRGGRVPLRW